MIKKTTTAISDWVNRNRGCSVLIVGIVEVVFLYFCWQDIIYFLRTGIGSQELPGWIGTMVSTFIIAPIAFFIWLFRNADKTQDLQHTEENIRQADFHKIQEWATTFPQNISRPVEIKTTTEQSTTQTNTDEDNSLKHRTEKETEPGVLQIAAIYQLLPYVKGEYGERFIRPAMEIYRSLLASWQWTEMEQQLAENGEIDQIIKPAYIVALHTVFRQEVDFFRSMHTLSFVKNSRWIPLSGINLKGVDFTWTDFTGANLSKTNLSWADLTGIDLTGADLKKANLAEANLTEADLAEANLLGANLSGVDLTRVNLSGAVLTGAMIDPELINLREIKLAKTNLREVNLIGINLTGIDLSEIDFSGKNLTGANLTGANLSKTNLSKANLTRTNLRKANLANGYLARADLSGADLRKADLTGADLRGAVFTMAFLMGAELQKVQFQGTDLRGADLRGAIYDKDAIKKAITDETTKFSDEDESED